MVDLKGTYVVECYRNGEKIWEETISNVVTKEGKTHMLAVAISKEENPSVGWYVGLIGANVTPSENDTASNALGATGTYQEITMYNSTVRPSYQGAVSGYSISNVNNPTSFQFNANNIVVYGVFIVNNPTKGSAHGVLLSAGKFSTPKTFSDGDALVVTYYINA